MAVPTLEVQTRAIYFDKANQSALETLRLTEQGFQAGDAESHELRLRRYELILACADEAIQTTGIVDPRAWVPVARNAFKYLRYRYANAGVHESMVMVSDKHEQARADQALLYVEALDWQANQPAYDAFRSLL